MDKIVCLVGESGSGKTSIALELEKLGYNFIESYTTRKPRYKGERGHTFINNVPIILNHCMIAYTYFDNEHYWSEKEQYQGKGTSIYIIDPAGVKTLKKNVKDAEIIIIYLRADEGTRFNRMYKRTQQYQKINRRMQHDFEAFKLIECNYCIDANRPLEEVLELVKQVIEGDNLESNQKE